MAKRALIHRVLASLGAVTLLSGMFAQSVGAVEPTPTYAIADVDGSPTEWSLEGDFFANMYMAGDPSKAVLSKAYLRYDCASGTLYVLVLAEAGTRVNVDSPGVVDSFVKSPAPNGSVLVNSQSGDDGAAPDFTWIDSQGSTALGYEASAALPVPAGGLLSATMQIHTEAVVDGRLETSSVSDRTATLEVDCRPPAPVAVNDSAATEYQTGVVGAVLGNDSGTLISVTSYTQPSNGTVTVNPDGSYSYTPNAGYTGTDSFTYTITDGFDRSATATVTITVNPPPVIELPPLTVTKTPSVTSVLFAGGAVTYRVSVTNPASVNVDLTGLVDDKFGDLDSDTASPHTWTTSTCSVPTTIAAGTAYTCSFAATVSGPAGGAHVNTITASATHVSGSTSTGSGSASVSLSWRGRTPGYWKNHPKSWPKFVIVNHRGQTITVSTSTKVTDVFNVHPSLLGAYGLDLNGNRKPDTLMEALSYKGGSTLGGATQILLRAGVAGLLNEQYFGSHYPTYSSTTTFISGVNAAATSGDRNRIISTATTIDNWNNGVH